MSSLASIFAARMPKLAASAQGETTPGSEVLGGKHPKRLGLNKRVQKISIVISFKLSRTSL